ncbi:MAG TPA: hypothetical protein VEQ11_15120 [Chloroflexota bacterium]|nr:hypothetical protein [Chloroflexota bacterium]
MQLRPAPDPASPPHDRRPRHHGQHSLVGQERLTSVLLKAERQSQQIVLGRAVGFRLAQGPALERSRRRLPGDQAVALSRALATRQAATTKGFAGQERGLVGLQPTRAAGRQAGSLGFALNEPLQDPASFWPEIAQVSKVF